MSSFLLLLEVFVHPAGDFFQPLDAVDGLAGAGQFVRFAVEQTESRRAAMQQQNLEIVMQLK